MEHAHWFRVDGKAGVTGWLESASLVALSLLATALLLSAFPGTALAAGECANEARRVEQSATALPDCRAYEMVTPSAKGSGGPEPIEQSEFFENRELRPLHPSELFGAAGARAAVDGDRMAWLSEPVPSSTSYGLDELAERGADGWVSHGLVPPLSLSNDLACPISSGVSGWSPDLSKAILDLPAGPPAANSASPLGFFNELECGHDEPRLVSGEPQHFRNLFVHDDASGGNRLINVTPKDVVWPEPTSFTPLYYPASLLAGSDDFSTVLFEEEVPLTQSAEEVSPEVKEGCERAEVTCWQGQDNLYEWSGGKVGLVTILPDGTPIQGSLAGATRNWYSITTEEESVNIAQSAHAISTDGSRVFFEAPGRLGAGDLYLREDGELTIQVDRAEPGAQGPSGGGDFKWASADGSRVFFTDEGELTRDSHAQPGKPDLYEYAIDSRSLTDLTAGSEGAGVMGVSGVSDDGGSVYFVAEGSLTGVPNAHGDSAVAGQPNLYLFRSGAISFIATLDREDDECDWITAAVCNKSTEARETGLTARIAGDGTLLAFDSVRKLTGYENANSVTGEPLIEIYLYDATTGRLVCASCDPTGAPMRFGAAIKSPSMQSQRQSIWHNAFLQRNLSDRGQVFFETADALLPGDINGRRDVYEYADGQLSLISSGESETGSYFLDAGADGANVFFATAQQLVGRDNDTLFDYYDVRVDGGFPEPPPSPPPCGGEACKGQSTSASASPVPGSAMVTGKGNVRPDRCALPQARARSLSERAKRLRQDAKQALQAGKQKVAKRREREAARAAQQAKNQSDAAKGCRQGGAKRPSKAKKGAAR